MNRCETNKKKKKNNRNSLKSKDNIKDLKIEKEPNNKYINKKRNIFKISHKLSKYRGVTKNKKKMASLYLDK